jgi:hypothetical protein
MGLVSDGCSIPTTRSDNKRVTIVVVGAFVWKNNDFKIQPRKQDHREQCMPCIGFWLKYIMPGPFHTHVIQNSRMQATHKAFMLVLVLPSSSSRDVLFSRIVHLGPYFFFQKLV